jgi:hypothetical protein
MKRILTEAAAVGDATARAIVFRTREQDAYYYPNSAWESIEQFSQTAGFLFRKPYKDANESCRMAL